MLLCEVFMFYNICAVLLFFFVKVSRQVRLELQDSEYFSVASEDAGRKVAPGLSATFTVFFSPQENKVPATKIDCFIG